MDKQVAQRWRLRAWRACSLQHSIRKTGRSLECLGLLASAWGHSQAYCMVSSISSSFKQHQALPGLEPGCLNSLKYLSVRGHKYLNNVWN